MSDYTGEIIAEASREHEEIIYGEYDLKRDAVQREYWGLLRDRQPHMYAKVCQNG